jgi:hypothetical protein
MIMYLLPVKVHFSNFLSVKNHKVAYRLSDVVFMATGSYKFRT